MNGYPTRQELKTVKNWDISKDGINQYIQYIESIWWMPDWGFDLKGKRIKWLKLHTGGWSGNEEIIYVMKQNLFWSLAWRKSRRGGHYYFKYDSELFKKVKERKKQQLKISDGKDNI